MSNHVLVLGTEADIRRLERMSFLYLKSPNQEVRFVSDVAQLHEALRESPQTVAYTGHMRQYDRGVGGDQTVVVPLKQILEEAGIKDANHIKMDHIEIDHTH